MTKSSPDEKHTKRPQDPPVPKDFLKPPRRPPRPHVPRRKHPRAAPEPAHREAREQTTPSEPTYKAQRRQALKDIHPKTRTRTRARRRRDGARTARPRIFFRRRAGPRALRQAGPAGAPERRRPAARLARARAPHGRGTALAPRAADAELLGRAGGVGRRGHAVPRTDVLRGLRVLGPGEVYEVRDAGVRAGLFGDASRGVCYEVWVLRDRGIVL